LSLTGCLPIQPLHCVGVAEDDGCESATTNGQNGTSAAGSTAWSRISTPDSLEWDPVEAPLAAASERPIEELDAETEQLLSEIERLTSRALRETGDWSSWSPLLYWVTIGWEPTSWALKIWITHVNLIVLWLLSRCFKCCELKDKYNIASNRCLPVLPNIHE